MNKRSFFPSVRAGSLAGLTIAGLMLSSLAAMAQVTGSSQTTTDASGKQQQSVALSASPSNKKGEKVVQSKDTKKEMQKEKKIQPVDAGLPDKVLYDKALDATKRGHFDVARLAEPDEGQAGNRRQLVQGGRHRSSHPGRAGVQGLHPLLPQRTRSRRVADVTGRHLLPSDG